MMSAFNINGKERHKFMITENTEAEEIESTAVSKKPEASQTEFKAWIEAFKQVWPIYLSTHIVFLVLTYLATLFRVDSHTLASFPLKTLLTSWNNWDSNWYTSIAVSGYTSI